MPVKEAKNVKERGGQMYYTLFLKFFSRNLFLCLHFEIISERLLSDDEGSASKISFFSARHKLHIFAPQVRGGAWAMIDVPDN